MKKIVTHIAPDADAVTSVWLLKRFLAGWHDAVLAFVPAGKTFNNDPVDSDPEILHVDTGMGMLDHHQTDEDTCAAKRTMEYIAAQISAKGRSSVGRKKDFPDEALERLIDVVNDLDHFREVNYPNPMADFYDFNLVSILDGWKLLYPDDNHKIVDLSILILDGVYKNFQNKVWAQKEIVDKGVEFESPWGKALGIETINDEVVRVAQRQGLILVIRKDPKKGFVRIKSQPESSADLTSCYNILKKLDSEATWYLHIGRKMLLNGSVKNPDSKPSKLTLREIIDVLKSV